jgi:hypothetical protein
VAFITSTRGGLRSHFFLRSSWLTQWVGLPGIANWPPYPFMPFPWTRTKLTGVEIIGLD